ncbi:phospholipid carrier-dependent glycosyltransferase [Aggregatilinea lenta]|uniref:phospholipid carrier-dependent glycosyltransferase n=1 Tax=Aggregatilinea lenta TaxID=913108 RepID=UPI000E5B17FA|nr:phospholipid carrier-dependent glycosyltransferase [Aggregatilinea lenta]
MQQVNLSSRWIARALDAVWLAALALYVVAGCWDVPFHGDESSLIAMSRDYASLVQQHDLDAVLYSPHPADPAMQELRILNGTVGKMAMGLGWDLAGLSAGDLNGPWDWSLDYDLNAALGHVPGDRLLHAARLSSALLAALAVVAVFGIVRIASGSRIAAWAASLILATDPAVLLNGRRAMMEGSLLGFGTLAALAAVWLVREQRRAAPPRRLWLGATALGIASGLAIASKHSAAIVIAALVVALVVEPGLRRVTEAHREQRDRRLRLAWAGALTAAVFLLLTPAWWSDPSGMPDRVLHARSVLMDGQVAKYGGFDGASERLGALVSRAFFDGPQYYEDPDWAAYVGGQIAAYDGSWLAGRGGGSVWGALLVTAFTAGCVACVVNVAARGEDGGPAWVVLAWAGLTALALLVTNPLDWQRYYLPLQPPVAAIAGIGVGAAARWSIRDWRERTPA